MAETIDVDIHIGANIKKGAAFCDDGDMRGIQCKTVQTEVPNADTLEAIEEVKRMKADTTIGKAYTDVKLMMEELLSDV